jgi:hypothetical protein
VSDVPPLTIAALQVVVLYRLALSAVAGEQLLTVVEVVVVLQVLVIPPLDAEPVCAVHEATGVVVDDVEHVVAL